MPEDAGVEPLFIRAVRYIMGLVVVTLIVTTTIVVFSLSAQQRRHPAKRMTTPATTRALPLPDDLWRPPDSTMIPVNEEGELIRYGKDLIAHTARYLGPKGTVQALSNGMNCQNCHLAAGTVPFGNNYAAVASTYPKFRARSGAVETMEKRINDCIERSLNGKPLDESSLEMRAIMAYFRWLGRNVKKGATPKGTGISSLPYLGRPADPMRGKGVYEKHCLVCHGKDGEGVKHPDSVEWLYPPLAGPQSYNTGAGLFRLSRFAGYVKSNMPYGTTWDKPVLSDEDCWDVAAYINSLPRPRKIFEGDWPDVSRKPFDHPFGPYADTFPEHQHKFGPFEPVIAATQK